MTRTTRKPLRVFCSYAHRDEHYLEVLKTWLVGLERDGLIEQWHDRMIPPGDEWEEAIAENLETSELVLLLVTPDFMASQYIYEKEIDRAIERHKRGEARVIPIIVRPAPWEGTALDRLQALPKNARAITTWANRDQAWLNVLQGIQQAVEELLFEPDGDEPEKAEQIYREAVEWAWTDGELHSREVERLGDLANEYELSTDRASAIEREAMGDTKEAIQERQERAAREEERKEQYRGAVEEAWTDNKLFKADAEGLGALASQLGLSTDTAAEIERKVMGDTKEAILERQEQISREEERRARERRERLDELYARARRSHQNQEWQGVVDIFELIRAEDPAYPDSTGLLATAREALETQEQMQGVTALYDRGQRHIDAGEWQQALECFEEVQRLEPGYRETETLLSQVRQELTPPPTAQVPDLRGQEVPQASSTLTSKDLELGSQHKAPGDTIPEGQIIGQSPEAGRDVQAGSLVNVTVSSGPTTVDVPNLDGRSHSEARSTLEAAGLELGSMTFAPSDDIPVDRVVRQSPGPGEKVTRGSSVRVTLSSGPQTVIEQSPPGPSLIDSFARICAKYTGSSYYLEEAITGEKLANARSSFPIPSTERVVALLDVTEDGSSKYGLAICEEGIRWCNERTSSGGLIYRRWRSTQRGTLQWSEFSDSYIEKHSGHNVIPIEIGENNIFFMTRIAMDPDDLVQLLSELQIFLKAYSQQGFYHSGDAKEKVEELGVDNTIMASNADQINRLYTLGHTYAVNAVAFSPDSKLLASGSAHAAVGLWRVEDSELLHGLVWHAGSVNTVAFSPDGKLLASGSEDRTVRLWRVEGGALLRELEEHTSKVNSVAFSADGKLLASGSDDKTVRLWGIT
jgi:WD40 repeat protein